MDDVTLARAFHVLALVHWIGGMAFVTLVVQIGHVVAAEATDLAIVFVVFDRLVDGDMVGLVFARFRAETWIKLVFSALVIVLSLFELVTLRKKSDERAQPLPGPIAATALSTAGVVHGLFACGGPLVVYVVSRTLRDKASFRATLSALWLIMNVVLVATMVRAGTIGGASLLTSAALAPPLLLGLVVGNRLHERLDERSFRVAVFSLLLVAAAVLLVRSL